MKSKLVLAIGMALGMAATGHAQALESTQALTCAIYSPYTTTASYASGAYVRMVLQPGGMAAVQAKLGDDLSLTSASVQVNWTATWDAPYYQHLTVQVPQFSMNLSDGSVLTIGPTFYVATRSGNSGRGGGNVYHIAPGAGEQQISY